MTLLVGAIAKAMGYHDKLDRSQPVLAMPGMPERRTHDCVRNGLTTLFAAFDVATGQVITALHRRHQAVEFKKS